MQRDFARAAQSYDEAAVLAHEVNARLLERLDYVRVAPKALADLGCATGAGVAALQQRYAEALPLALDFARPMLHAARRRCPAVLPIQADARQLPLAANSLDLIYSNLMLHWLDEPGAAFREALRVLRAQGLFLFALLGPDTLKELRAAGLASLRRFIDMHDIGDLLIESGFAEPVMDMETLTLEYATLRQFLADQRHLGVHRGLFGAAGYRTLRAALRRYPARAGVYSAHFEIIYGLAWKPAARQEEAGRAIIRFQRQR